MKPFKPDDVPNTPHPHFSFDYLNNNPVAGGKIDLGGKWPEASEFPKDEHWKDWAVACNHIREMLSAYNEALMAYMIKDPKGEKPTGPAADPYKAQAKNIREFMKDGDDGYEKFFEKGSFVMEVVESAGFAVAVRIIGLTKENKTSTEGRETQEGNTTQEEGIRSNHSSSSSYYSLSSPRC